MGVITDNNNYEIDLHNPSNCSDGVLSPTEVVHLAKENN